MSAVPSPGESSLKRAENKESYIVNTEIVKRLSDLNLLLQVEEGIGELLALTQRRLNDLEGSNIAQKVGDRLVRIPVSHGRDLDSLEVILVGA